MRPFRYLLAALCLLATPALAQLALTGAGLGRPGAVASYTGIGNLALSTPLAWWGLRCYSDAYNGNVADVWDGATGSTTETLIKCSAHGILNQTINALSVTCAVSCRVKTLYDQTAGTACGGAVCDVTQATNANRPVLTLSCAGLTGSNTWCLTGSGSVQKLVNATGVTQAQPVTAEMVAVRTGNFITTQQVVFSGASGGTPQLAFNTSANNISANAGATQTVAATDGAWWVALATFNGASNSELYVEGTSTVNSLGTNGMTSTLTTMNSNFTGNFVEGGWWGASLISSFAAITSNARTYWGV